MQTFIRKLIRRVTPPSLLRWYRQSRVLRARQLFASLSTREAFIKIYDENRWGGASGEICSGSGSSQEQATAYANVIRSFISENKVQTILDLGCGDFTVGKTIQMPSTSYIGVDIVPRVIERNQLFFQQSHIQFKCLDILEDPLPKADLCLIRQVLQHLSNAQIETILRKTAHFKWLVITEHLPSPKALTSPNLDKPHGPDTRLVDGSGVFLEAPPFNLKAGRVLLDHVVSEPLIADGERLLTLVFSNTFNE
jgi:SAM-dependent methyltransferase